MVERPFTSKCDRCLNFDGCEWYDTVGEMEEAAANFTNEEIAYPWLAANFDFHCESFKEDQTAGVS